MIPTLFALSAVALAAEPMGDPTRSGQLLTVDLMGHGDKHNEAVAACEGDRCLSGSAARMGNLRVGLRPHEAVGAWVDLGYGKTTISGAGHKAFGPSVGGGLNLTWPTTGPRPALVVRGGYDRSVAQGDDGARSTATGWELEVSALLAVGGPSHEVAAWVGPVVSALGARSVSVPADDVLLNLSPQIPVGLVAGAELFSIPLGPPWSTSGPRLMVGGEVRGIDAWGASVWVGVAAF
ncbi:hypothetical protein L6R46_29245 [Myxococcota bacterium]|nr:hypothetical protein [Myxococcota bacterium]